MMNIDKPIRIGALAVAVVLVTGTTYALGSYSDAKFAEALATAHGQPMNATAQTAVAPARIDVVGKRLARTAA